MAKCGICQGQTKGRYYVTPYIKSCYGVLCDKCKEGIIHKITGTIKAVKT